MSHKANHALSALPADACNGSGFRVLFHLCDSHNSLRDVEDACFPSQARLMERTGLSNGGLNKVLNALEEAGLISRIKGRMENGQRRQTRYILWFDCPTPQCGEGKSHLHSEPQPSPLEEQTQLHLSGEESVSITTKGTGKNIDASPSAKSRLPEGWTPDEDMVSYAKSEKLNDAEIKRIADDFFAYWDDQPKSKSTKSLRGWRATWRNRVDAVAWRFIKNRGGSNTNSHAGIGSGTARAAAAVAERRINGQGNGGGADW